MPAYRWPIPPADRWAIIAYGAGDAAAQAAGKRGPRARHPQPGSPSATSVPASAAEATAAKPAGNR